jgi:FkbM family methyltransferase
MSLVTVEGHTIHPRFVGPSSVVLDVGANLGNFATQVAERFGCVCHAVEPNPDVLAHIPAHPRVHKHRLAIAGRSGTITLNVDADDHEWSALRPLKGRRYREAIDVPAVTLEEFAAGLGLSEIDVLKLDIEGSEVEVLDACSDAFLGRVGQIALELHDFTGQVSPAEVTRVLARLRRLGFCVIKMARKSYIDTLAINRRRCPLSTAECLYLRHGVRNWHGLCRMVGRWLGAPPPPNARPSAPVRG